MPVNIDPIFTDIPLIGSAKFVNGTDTAAGTDRTGATGTVKTLVTGTTYGVRVDRVQGVSSANGVIPAKIVYLWLHDGTNFIFLADLELPGLTSSTTAAGPTNQIIFDRGLIIPLNWTLRCAVSILGTALDNCDVTSYSGDYTLVT